MPSYLGGTYAIKRYEELVRRARRGLGRGILLARRGVAGLPIFRRGALRGAAAMPDVAGVPFGRSPRRIVAFEEDAVAVACVEARQARGTGWMSRSRTSL